MASAAPTQVTDDTPPAGEASVLPYGQWATVTGDRLRVRYGPGMTDAEARTTISAGTSLFLDGAGAVNADGYQWYWIQHGAVVGDDGYVHADGRGWIAGGTADGAETYIEFTSSSCPASPIDAETFAGLSDWAKESCGVGSLTRLSGMLDQPIEGPVTPFAYEPAWLWFSAWYLTDPTEADDVFLGAGWAFSVHFPPGFEIDGLQRGDLLTVSGHINDPAADACRVVAQAPEGPEPTDGMQQAFANTCRVAFVVDELEVTGHVELPPG
jgi:hypothetical protein